MTQGGGVVRQRGKDMWFRHPARRWLPALLLSLGTGLGQAPLSNDQLAVSFAVGEYINLEYADRVIEFANLKPDDQGWSDALTPDGLPDLAVLLVTSNVPFRIDYDGGSDLSNGLAMLPLQIGLRLRGLGHVEGQTFDTGPDWATTWGAWLDCGEGGVAVGRVHYEPGYRFGLTARARLFRQGLLDPPGEYSQPVPMTWLVSTR